MKKMYSICGVLNFDPEQGRWTSSGPTILSLHPHLSDQGAKAHKISGVSLWPDMHFFKNDKKRTLNLPKFYQMSILDWEKVFNATCEVLGINESAQNFLLAHCHEDPSASTLLFIKEGRVTLKPLLLREEHIQSMSSDLPRVRGASILMETALNGSDEATKDYAIECIEELYLKVQKGV